MNDGVTRILWYSADLQSTERFTSGPSSGGWRLAGTLVLPIEGEPAQITYTVDVDPAWRARRVDATVERAEGVRRVEMSADGDGWTVQGVPAGALDGCVDVDLAFSPATNTLPIRRLASAAGARSLPVAWLRFPELDVVRSEQTYTRLGPHRWRFRLDDFTAELEVDAGGHVLRYGAARTGAAAERAAVTDLRPPRGDLWVALAHRVG